MSIWADDPLADTSDTITVYDWFLGTGESIASGKQVKVEWICGKWYVTFWEIETQSVITDFQVTGQTLQVKTRDISILPKGAESGWTTKHTGTTCP